jgi:hypothetical protein
MKIEIRCWQIRNLFLNGEMIMKKIFLIFGLIIISKADLVQAGSSDQIAKPIPPTNNCGQYNYQTQYSYYSTCISAYNRDVVVYQNQVNAYNQLNYQNPSGQITTNNSGLLAAPTPPHNNCGSQPSSGDIGAYQTWNGCNSAYQAELSAYNQSKNSFDYINGQISQSATLQAQQNAQTAEAQKLQTISDETVTGSLNQVQSNNQGASKIYAVAGAALAGYAVYNMSVGYFNSSMCNPYNTPACAMAATAFAAAAAYSLLNQKANNQIKDFGDNKVKVCEAQNALSGTQANCQFTTPGSPVAIPEIVTPPDPTWYDASTGQCKPEAPQLCKDIQAGDNGYQPNGTTVPKITATCTGGGVSCMAGSGPTITQTPKGTKVSFKDKNGKEYSYYEGDFADEKSMIAAGLSPSAAKKLSMELAAVDGDASKKLAANEDKKDADEKPDLSGLNGNIAFGSGAFGADGTGVDGKLGKKFKDNLNAAKDLARKPSAIGLNKDFHGDLIGMADDDIFGMMNRRYKLKDEQDTFITPVAP